MNGVGFDGGNVRFTVGDLRVIHSVNGGKFDLDGKYAIVYSNVRAEYGDVADEITLQNNESVVLRKAG